MRGIPLALWAVVGLTGGFFAFGAAFAAPAPAKIPANRQGGTSLRYLALGDSYTIGEGVEPAERWPHQLAALLAAEGLRFETAPEIVARTGWTTDELSAAISEAKPKGPFDLVTLLIGVNDQFRGRGVEAYRPEFRRLLQAAIGFAGNRPERVIVLSIPDWGVTSFAASSERFVPERIAREIDAFDAAAKAETEGAGAAFLDVTEETRTAGRKAGELVDDGLHPSGRQYERWAQA
ncbi:MAG TPA: GDSL-type esterase/lipase family protein, partial [Thermoanaerobaculia bacterium]|nr:GDSL-type esterase/lipase family protein [Thermoanaerobaculia bacterium]